VKVDPKSRKVVFDDKDPHLNPDAVLRTLRAQERARFASEVSGGPAAPDQQ
jgi:hypothetical protein